MLVKFGMKGKGEMMNIYLSKDLKFFKWLILFTVMVFTAYPAVELTRCILQYNVLPGTYPPDYQAWVFIAELCIIWIGWLFVPFIVWVSFHIIDKKIKAPYIN